jgi:hypothetical protein
MRWALFLLGALTACNALIGLKEPQVHEEPDAAPGPFQAYTSGTRLRAEVWDVDGVRALHGWYDTKRQESCAFDHFGDSTKPRYCLPTDADDVNTFDDPDCTMPVDPTTTPKTYLIVHRPHACDGPPVVYTAGPLVPIKALYVGAPGACAIQAGPSQAYRPGDPVPLDALVSARETVENRGGRIASLVLATDDGAREVIGGYDTDRKEASWVPPGNAWPGITDPTWLPSHFAWHWPNHLREFYTDPACANVIAASYTPRYVSCPFTAVMGDPPVSQIGDPIDAAVVRTRDGDGGCTLVTALGYDFIYFGLGDAVDTTTLAPATSTKVGAGRVQLVFDATDATGPIAAPVATPEQPIAYTNFFDTTWNARCELNATADGLTRCLPTTTVQLVYSDAACSAPAAQFYADPIPAVALLTLDPSHYAARKIGPKIGDAYYTRSGATCQKFNGPCFELGEDVSTQFEVVTDVRE